MMLRIVFVSILVFFIGGCTTVMDRAEVALASSAIAPKAKKMPDGQFVVPTFSVPESGLQFSTVSPDMAASTFGQMTTALPRNEKVHLTRVILSLAAYNSCVENGYGSAVVANSPFVRKKKSSNCNVINYYLDSQNPANSLLRLGRPDSQTLRLSQTTYGGAPVGDAVLVGRSDSDSWQQWINYGGSILNGKTRTDIMQEFLQQTNGALSWQRY